MTLSPTRIRLALLALALGGFGIGLTEFVAWLAVPVILGLATSAAGFGRSFRTPAIIVLAIAALTQVVYPYLYNDLLVPLPYIVAVLTVRNLLYFVLLGWAIHAIATAVPEEDEELLDETWLPSVWPLADQVEPATTTKD